VVGGGQAALAVGYYLRRRTDLSFAILDSEDGPGGAWRHGWDSLRGFSPARYSSLPGRLMPGGEEKYPTRDEVVNYLADYEKRYELPVRRPVRVEAVYREEGRLAVKMDRVRLPVRAVVGATGTWRRPHVPDYPGRGRFRGELDPFGPLRPPRAVRGQTGAHRRRGQLGGPGSR
jgi:putative flavoprotein involved in K+ transport